MHVQFYQSRNYKKEISYYVFAYSLENLTKIQISQKKVVNNNTAKKPNYSMKVQKNNAHLDKFNR